MINLKETFEKFDADYLKFDRIENPVSNRSDLCAFIFLDNLIKNGPRLIIAGAEHDKIYLEVDCDELAEIVTEDDILFLMRCGMGYDEECHSLYMFA